MLTLVLISMSLFIAFNAIGIYKFGFLDCFSAYGMKWESIKKRNGLNLWSLITIVTALLLMPPCLESAEGNSFQFLCFFAPLGLVLVGLTPHYKQSSKLWTIHSIGAYISAILICIWIIFIAKYGYILLYYTISIGLVALISKTFKSSLTYWLELIVYFSTYSTFYYIFS